MACGWDRAANIANAEKLVRAAARQGARIILLQELFETPYFCMDHDGEYFALARPIDQNPALARMRELARELDVVLPVSIFERAHNAYFNTLAMVDAGGELMGLYRKSHIPESVGYHEKYYFSPGDTGFKVWKTRYGSVGVGVCWDQWFPESARIMALLGADLLMYPTAIGSEPADPSVDSRDHWQRVMQGHAAANLDAADRVESHRPRARQEALRDVLRFLVHRGSHGRQARGSRPGERSNHHGRFRSRARARLPALVGPVS